VRPTDAHIVAIGEQLRDGQLDPLLGVWVALEGREVDLDHGRLPSISDAQVDLLSYDATTSHETLGGHFRTHPGARSRPFRV
jgi:hypothetical protein